jgi:SAM-dependent methyltransferase
MTPNRPPSPIKLEHERAGRAFHAFNRAVRGYTSNAIYADAYAAYERELKHRGATNGGRPKDKHATNEVLDDLLSFQLFSYFWRNLSRTGFSDPEYGTVGLARRQAPRILPYLEAKAVEGIRSGRLRLDPDLELPEYYKLCDFHQHPGGVWSDPMAGVVYEHGRVGMDQTGGDDIYRMIFSYLPKDRKYARVLDWGTGHGAGLLTWHESHPESELHGVDLSAPCLKLAHARASEYGVEAFFSQQDVAHLDYPDDHFDAVFFLFMLHELAPGHLPALFEEVRRVLKPGGVFLGMELAYVENDPFQHAIKDQMSWANNETFETACLEMDLGAKFRAAGFR